MRSIALFLELTILLPIVLVRPFVGVILWAWVSFMNPHRLVYDGFAVDVPWAMLIFIATIIGCLLAREPKQLPVNAFTGLVTLFLAMITLTTAFALAPWDNVLGKYELVFKVFLFLLVTSALLTSKERIHALIWIMVISLGFFGIKGGGFTLLGGGTNRVYGPDASMISDNNHIATALLVALPLMNYLRMESRHAIVRYGLLATMTLTLFAIVGSYSRGALLGLGAVCAYFWWKSPGKIISAALLVIVVGAALAFMPDHWFDRMHSIQTYDEDASAMSRLEIWKVAWAIATSRPLTGGGFLATYIQPVVTLFVPDATTRAVHSIWLEVLAEHGFPTFFVWVGIIVVGALYARRIIKQATGVPGLEWCVNLAKMAQVSMIAYLVGGSFLSLSYWDYYFTLLAVVTATYQLVRVATVPKSTGSPFAPRPLPAPITAPR